MAINNFFIMRCSRKNDRFRKPRLNKFSKNALATTMTLFIRENSKYLKRTSATEKKL